MHRARSTSTGPALKALLAGSLLLVVANTMATTAQERPPAANPASGRLEVTGTYAAPVNGDMRVILQGSSLILRMPGQPDFPLNFMGGESYRLGPPAPNGFVATFRAGTMARKSLEMHLQRPNDEIVVPRRDTVPLESSQAENRDLFGVYRATQSKVAPADSKMEIAAMGGQLVLLNNNNPAFPLIPAGRDVFHIDNGQPRGTFVVSVRREGGQPTGFVIKQPAGTIAYVSAGTPEELTAEQVRERMVEALGGEAPLRARKTLLEVAEVEYQAGSQTLTGSTRTWWRAPTSQASDVELSPPGGTGKVTSRSRFDGKRGISLVDGQPTKRMSGAEIDWQLIESPHEPLLWGQLYRSVTLLGTRTYAGINCYAVQKTMQSGRIITEFITSDTFLPAGSEGPNEIDGQPYKQTLFKRDWRSVEGVKRPFTISMNAGDANISIRLTSAQWNIAIPDAYFVVRDPGTRPDPSAKGKKAK